MESSQNNVKRHLTKMIPYSVRMRKAGFVFDPAVRGCSIYNPKWVPAGTTVADLKAKYSAKVERTADVLHRFLVRCARQHRSRKAYSAVMCKYYAERAANPRFHWSGPNWGDIALDEEEKEKAYFMMITDEEWRAYGRARIAECKEAGRDIMPFIEFSKEIWAARDKLAEQQAIWDELARKPLPQPRAMPSAQVRRVRPNAFAALADSDSEELERILRG